MSDKRKLRGFIGHPRDLRDRLRLCRPLLSFENAPSIILLARELDWRVGTRSLRSIDETEVSRFGTLLTNDAVDISPGVGVAVMGEEVVQAVAAAGLEGVGTLGFSTAGEDRYKVAVCRRSDFELFVERLVAAAKTVFDEEFSKGGHGVLSNRGQGALFLLRRAPLRQNFEVVVRRLACCAHETSEERRAYSDLLAYFAHDLNRGQDMLAESVRAYMAKQLWTRTTPTPTYGLVYERVAYAPPDVPGQPVGHHHSYPVLSESWVPNERVALLCEPGDKRSYMDEHAYGGSLNKDPFMLNPEDFESWHRTGEKKMTLRKRQWSTRSPRHDV